MLCLRAKRNDTFSFNKSFKKCFLILTKKTKELLSSWINCSSRVFCHHFWINKVVEDLKVRECSETPSLLLPVTVRCTNVTLTCEGKCHTPKPHLLSHDCRALGWKRAPAVLLCLCFSRGNLLHQVAGPGTFKHSSGANHSTWVGLKEKIMYWY